MADLKKELESIEEMYQKGLTDRETYEHMKNEILKNMPREEPVQTFSAPPPPAQTAPPPVRTEPPPPPPVTPPPAPTQEAFSAPVNSYRAPKQNISVLIVDDSALIRNLFGRMIEDTPGFTIADKAMNGKFALDKIPKCNPDIILLDLEMPEMNGIEFLKERKRRGINIPVVVLSSIRAKDIEAANEAISLGACDHIPKPSGSVSEDINIVKENLITMLRKYGG